MKPVHVATLSEFEMFFGKAPTPVFEVKAGDASNKELSINGKPYLVEQGANTSFYLNNSLKLFFDNGGADCYIVSVGQYGDPANPPQLEADAFKKGIDTLEGEEMPTMILMPDSLLLDEEDGSYYAVQAYALQHCGKNMNKVALFDVWGGGEELPPEEDKNKYVTRFRENIGLEQLSYGAAYYPWLKTNIIPLSSVGYQNFKLDSLAPIIREEHQPIFGNLKNAETEKEKAYWDMGLKGASK